MGHNATGEKSGKVTKVWMYLILLFQLALIGSLIKGLQLSYKSRDRVAMLKETKAKLEGENTELKNKVMYVQSDYYVEKVAREELQRAKPGETVVILPENKGEAPVSGEPRKKEVRILKNWEKWWELLVK